MTIRRDSRKRLPISIRVKKHSSRLAFGVGSGSEFYNDAVVRVFVGYSGILDQPLLDGNADVFLCQEHFQFLESLEEGR